MILEDYGWDSWFDDQYKSLNMHLKAGRIVGNSDIYKVVSEEGIIEARISDRLFYSTSSDSELPVPGDWVLVIPDDSDSGYSIYDLLPRRSLLVFPDQESPDEQIAAAANIDYIIAAFPAVDGYENGAVENLKDLSRDWGAQPLFVYYGATSGTDVKEGLIKSAGDSGIIFIDSIDKSGLAEISRTLTPGKTYAVTGDNLKDVSAIINYLAGNESAENAVLNHNLSKGVLHFLNSCAILLDTPLPCDIDLFNGSCHGDDFEDIIEIASLCRFNDCRHENEPGCTILEALDNGDLDYDHYKEYQRALKKGSGSIFSPEQAEIKKNKKNADLKSVKSIEL